MIRYNPKSQGFRDLRFSDRIRVLNALNSTNLDVAMDRLTHLYNSGKINTVGLFFGLAHWSNLCDLQEWQG